MAGEDHGCDLIAELRVGESLPGLGIARGVHQIEQIVRRRACILAGGARSAISIAMKPVQRLRKRAREYPAGSAMPAAAACREMRPRQPRAIFHHEVA